MAELVMSVHLTKLDRELREVREVKVTIRRLRNGRYGKRVECNAASDEDDCGRIRWCAVALIPLDPRLERLQVDPFGASPGECVVHTRVGLRDVGG